MIEVLVDRLIEEARMVSELLNQTIDRLLAIEEKIRKLEERMGRDE